MNSSQTSNNPWLALSTYEETDLYRFKGRDEDIEKLFNMIQQNELAVCYAASGDGKSSLINAGLCPKLRRVGYFPVKIVFSTSEYNGNNIPLKQDGTYDIDALVSRKIDENIRTYQSHFEMEKGLESGGYPIAFKRLSEFGETNSRNALWWKLRTESIEIPFGEFDYRPLLIFDQFEELFSAKWKSDFFAWLETLMNDTCPRHLIEKEERGQLPSSKQFKVLFSLRYEYVGELDYWSSQLYFIPQMMRNRYFLKPMTREQAVRAIKEQDGIDLMRDKFNSAAERIVDDIIASVSIDGGDHQIPSIVLSVLCFMYYEAWSGGRNVSVDAFTANSLIYEYYKSVFDDKTIDISPDRRNGLEDILISNSGTRRRMPSSDERLLALNIDKPLLMQLKEKHVLRIDSVLDSNGKTEDYVELVHDRVVKAIFVCRKEEKEALAKERKKFRGKMIVLASCFILCVAVLAVMFGMNFLPKSKSIVKKGENIEKTDDNFPVDDVRLDTLLFEGDNRIDQSPNYNASVVKVCGDNVMFKNKSFADAILEKLVIDVDSAKSIIIGDSAFYNCSNLEGIRVDADFVSLRSMSFAHCHRLRSVSLRGNSIYIYDNCFSDCNKIREFDIKGDNVSLHNVWGCGRIGRMEINGDQISAVCLPESDTLIFNGSFYFSELPKERYQWFDVFEIGEQTMLNIAYPEEGRGLQYGTLITHNNKHIKIDDSSCYEKVVYFDSFYLGKFRYVIDSMDQGSHHSRIQIDSNVDYPSMVYVSKADRWDYGGRLCKKNKIISLDSAISIKGYRCYGNVARRGGGGNKSRIFVAGKARDVVLWTAGDCDWAQLKSVEKIILPYPFRISFPNTASFELFVPYGYKEYYKQINENNYVKIKEMGLLKTFWYRMQSKIRPYYPYPFLYPLVAFVLIVVYVYWGRLRNPKSPYIYENRTRAIASVFTFPMIYYLCLALTILCNGGYRPIIYQICFSSIGFWLCVDIVFFAKNVRKKKIWKDCSHKERVIIILMWVMVMMMACILGLVWFFDS